MTLLTVDLLAEEEGWRKLRQLDELVRQAASAAAAKAAKANGESGPFLLTVNLSNDAAVRDLNKRFRDKDRPTNVLSFPLEAEEHPHLQGPEPLGDIILGLETVLHEADEQQKQLSHHLSHLVVHGVLHLFGYDHMENAEAEEMEALEVEILAGLNIPSPYAA